MISAELPLPTQLTPFIVYVYSIPSCRPGIITDVFCIEHCPLLHIPELGGGDIASLYDSNLIEPKVPIDVQFSDTLS